MIDHENEDLIPFEACGQLIPGRPTRCTLYRWSFKGIRGAKLESLVVGHKRFTSREAVGRFIAAMNAGQTPAPAFTPSQRRRQAETADRLLQEAGL